MPDRVIGSRYASHLGVLPYDQFALRETGAMSDKNEQRSSRARLTSTSAGSQRLLQRGGASARILTLIAVTAILALGGLGTRSVAASSRSLALGSGRSGILNGVSADSATDAWAVGYYFNQTTNAQETFVLHWNGTSWSEVASPNPGGTTSASDASTLFGVSAVSATDAWAVGYYVVNPTTQAQETLVLHWNGTKWSKVASPSPGGTSMNFEINTLNGVSAVSATDASAVGSYNNPTTGATETLALHWNGTKWSKVASPSPGGTSMNFDNSFLHGVSADSATDAWAVGHYISSTTAGTEAVALHWNGTKWSKIASPNPGGTIASAYNTLNGISAVSATDAWAVGFYNNPAIGDETLVLHWNGTKWSKVASPSPGVPPVFFSGDNLFGVSAVSATDASAVGSYVNPTTGATETLALHWNGTKWSKVASPNPGGTTSNADDASTLYGVSAVSATDAWAVGYYTGTTLVPGTTLVLHWNGTSWSRA
jgi:hypothetical protein